MCVMFDGKVLYCMVLYVMWEGRGLLTQKDVHCFILAPQAPVEIRQYFIKFS